MFTLKHLKNAPTCFDLIQIIFRELICFLLKSLILIFVKNVKVNVVMRQHNIWCVNVTVCVKMCAGLQSGTHLHTERNAVRHTSSHRTDCSPAHIFTQNGLQSGTHLHTERTAVPHTSLHRTDCSPAHIFTQNGLQSGTHLHTERTAVQHTSSHRTDCSPAHIFTRNVTYTHQMLCCRITTLTFIF